VAFLLLLALAQDLDGALRDLRDERADVRDRGSAALLAGWERWTDADLDRLEDGRKGADAEVAGRISDAVGTIRLRRSLGKALLTRIPGLDRIATNGTADERREVLLSLRRSWRLAEVDSERLRALAETMAARGFELEEKDALLEDLIPPYRPLLRPGFRRPELRWQTLDRVKDLGAQEFLPEVRPLLKDPDVRVRLEAASVLESWDLRDGLGVAVEALDHADPVIAARAAGLVSRLEAREHGPRLLALLKAADDPGVRKSLVWPVRRLLGAAAETDLAALIDDPDAQVRMKVYGALADLGARNRAPALLERLRDAEGHEFWELKDALLELGLEPLRKRLEALCSDPRGVTRSAAWDLLSSLDVDLPLRFLDHENPETREYAVWALVDLNRPADADRFLALLSDPAPEIRRAALDGLASTGGPRHVDAVASRLVDREGNVRWTALYALAALQARNRADDAAERLKDVHGWVPREAVGTLGELGARKHADRLRELLRSDLAPDALRALARMGEKLDYAALLTHEEWEIRLRAVEALDQLGLATVERLAPRLEDDINDVAVAAVRALAWIGTDDAVKALRRYEEKDSEIVALALFDLGRADVLPLALERLADPNRTQRRFACEWLARWTTRGLPVPDLERLGRQLDRADEGEDGLTSPVTLAIRVALGLRGPKDLLPDDFDRLPQDIAFPVLCRVFSPEATATLHRPFVPEKDIDSPAAMSAALEKAWGVKVDVDPAYYFPGIHPAGARTSGMRLIERLLRRHRPRRSYIPSTGLVAEGAVFRVVLEDDARRFWRKRLEGR
jgi:HEAT repeat protein